jgi:hypothetical protein
VCAACGAPLASDQRYCLECGERRVPVSSFLQSGPPPAATAAPPSAPPGPLRLPPATSAEHEARNPTLMVIAGVGVLLLAMGVGVLIGRSGSGSGSQRPAAAQVITVGSAPATGAGSEAAFTSDWPAGKSGYTVQLQTLTQSGTSTSQVEAARTSAEAKGAAEVGALKSEEFTSLPGGEYVIYSGEYSKHGEAQKALSTLKKKFPGAKVVKVSNGKGAGGAGKGASGSSGAGSNINNPAPPSVLEGESHAKGGKSFEEKSKELPDVVETD